MNLKPEQIPDEAARIALETYYNAPFAGGGILVNDMKAALAAALPVLLGEPVMWDVSWYCYRLDRPGRESFATEGEARDFVASKLATSRVFNAITPLYTLPTQDTPNER